MVTAIEVRRKSAISWVLIPDGVAANDVQEAWWRGTRIGNNITFKSTNGAVEFKDINYQFISYVDEVTPANNKASFTSAYECFNYLKEQGFFDVGSDGGVSGSTFIGDDDTPATYLGQALKLLRVNASATAVEFFQKVIASQLSELADGPGAYSNGKYLKSTASGWVWSDGFNVNQNNIGLKVSLGFHISETPPAITDIVTLANQTTIVVSEIQTPVIISVRSLPSILGGNPTVNKLYPYLFLPGKGTYGISGTAVTPAMLFQLPSLNLTPEDIEDDPNASIVNLDPVVDGDFVSKANESFWDFSDSDYQNGGQSYYFSYTDDGVLYYALFIGTPGTYGDGATAFTEDDFVDTTNSGVVPEPSLTEELGWKSPQDYGAIGDGVTDDTLAVQQCNLENNNPFWFGTYLVTETIEFKENQTLFSNNATIKRLSNTGDILYFNNVNNFSIGGNLTIEGNGKSNNTAVGLHIDKGDNFKIEGLTVKDIAGKGIYFTGESINRGNRGVLSNISLQNNWIGAGWQALAEYSTLKNVNAQGNSIGLEILAGNVGVIGGSITDNDNGIYVGGAYATNNSHGIFQGLNVNHNTGYDLKAENVQYGQTITGCHFYGTSSEGGVEIINSYGVMFNGCIIDGILSNTDSNTPKGFNMLNACQLEPEFTLSGNPVLLRNCFIKNAGLSPLNNYDAYGNNEVLASGYDDFGNMSVRTLDNFGAGVGGTLSFAGSAGGSTPFDAAFGKIKGYKLDANSGFIDGVLAFGTSNNSVAPYFNYHMYLNNLGNLLIGNSTDSGNGERLQVNGRASASDPVNEGDLVTLRTVNSFGGVYIAKTANYTLVYADGVVDFTSGNNVATLPDATTMPGKRYFIKNSGTGVTIVNTTSAQTIDGLTRYDLIVKNSAVMMVSDGSNWKILTSHSNGSVIDNTYTTSKTSSQLNADYSGAAFPFVVYAPLTAGSPMVYIKTSATVWIAYAGVIA